MNVIEKAARVAIVAHKDQKRKDDGFPYIVHPFMVANKLAQHNFSDEVIAAGLVHDVLEDSSTSQQELEKEGKVILFNPPPFGPYSCPKCFNKLEET